MRMMEFGYRLRRWTMRRLRWRTRGVKVMVFDAHGRVLLIRNRYGDQETWLLPGGGIARREPPDQAARREVMEEVACRLTDLIPVGTFQARAEGRRDTVHLFRGLTADEPRPDGVEVAEARFFAPDDLPGGVSPATRRRIDEVAGRRTVTGDW